MRPGIFAGTYRHTLSAAAMIQNRPATRDLLNEAPFDYFCRSGLRARSPTLSPPQSYSRADPVPVSWLQLRNVQPNCWRHRGINKDQVEGRIKEGGGKVEEVPPR